MKNREIFLCVGAVLLLVGCSMYRSEDEMRLACSNQGYERGSQAFAICMADQHTIEARKAQYLRNAINNLPQNNSTSIVQDSFLYPL